MNENFKPIDCCPINKIIIFLNLWNEINRLLCKVMENLGITWFNVSYSEYVNGKNVRII